MNIKEINETIKVLTSVINKVININHAEKLLNHTFKKSEYVEIKVINRVAYKVYTVTVFKGHFTQILTYDDLIGDVKCAINNQLNENLSEI